MGRSDQAEKGGRATGRRTALVSGLGDARPAGRDQLFGDAEAERGTEPDGVALELAYVLQQVLKSLLGIAGVEVDELRPHLGDVASKLLFADRSRVHLCC